MSTFSRQDHIQLYRENKHIKSDRMKTTILPLFAGILITSFILLHNPKVQAECPDGQTQETQALIPDRQTPPQNWQMPAQNSASDITWDCSWQPVSECAPGNGDGRNVSVSIVGRTRYEVDWCYDDDCQKCNTPCTPNDTLPSQPITADCPSCGAENIKKFVWRCRKQ